MILIKTVRKTLRRTVAIGIKTRAIWERGQAELENNEEEWEIYSLGSECGGGGVSG